MSKPLSPSRFRALLTCLPTLAGVLVVVQLVLRGWALAGAWFWQDDFVYTHLARTLPAWDFVFSDYHGHLQPGQFLLVRALARAVPLEWAPHAAVLLGLQLVADLVFIALLVELFGPRRAVLLPFSVFLFCPLTVPSLLWFAAAVQWLPLTILSTLLLLLHVRMHRGAGWRTEVAALTVLVVALAFSERALLLPVVAALVEVLWLARGAGRERVLVPLRRSPVVWAGYVVVSVGYLALYGRLTAAVPVAAPSPGDVVRLVRESVLVTWLPGLVGGPWSGSGRLQTLLPAPPVPVAWLAGQLVVAVLVLSVLWRGWAAVRAWLVPGVVLVVGVAVVAAARLDFVGPAIGRDPRYVADVVPTTALALGVAFLGVRASPGDPRPAPVSARLRALVARCGPASRAAVLAVLVVGYANSAWATTYALARDRHDSAAERWTTAARQSLAALPAGVGVVDAPVPPAVVDPAVFLDDARGSRVLGSLPEGRERFDVTTDDLRVLDGGGAPVPATVLGYAAAPPGPVPGCGYRVAGASHPVPVRPTLPPSDWVVRIGYYSGSGGLARVDVGDERLTVLLPAGVARVYVFPSGEVDGLRISGVDVGSGLCVTDVVVGRAWPQT